MSIKLKDLFTILNLFLAFYAVILLFNHQLEWASYLMFINITIIDVLDGLVARITKTYNDFGKHLDTLVDFIGSSIFIPFFVYMALRDISEYGAIILAFLPLLFGVLRDIQGKLISLKHVGYFIGLPRIISGLFIIALMNTPLVHSETGFIIASILIVFVCVLNLVHWPYLGNDKREVSLSPKIKFYLIFSVVALAGLFYLGQFWEGMAILLGGYIIHPLAITEKEIWLSVKNQKNKYKQSLLHGA